MCGPYECLIFEKGFISRLKRDRLTLVWASLWGPLLLLWILYAAVQLRNLATALEDQSFQAIPLPPQDQTFFNSVITQILTV